jgi:hypothetical protein
MQYKIYDYNICNDCIQKISNFNTNINTNTNINMDVEGFICVNSKSEYSIDNVMQFKIYVIFIFIKIILNFYKYCNNKCTE